MTTRLEPLQAPDVNDPEAVRVWTEQQLNTLVGAYLRKHADVLIKIAGRAPTGVRTLMPIESVANMLDEMAWEIETRQVHQTCQPLDSAKDAHEFLSRIINNP